MDYKLFIVHLGRVEIIVNSFTPPKYDFVEGEYGFTNRKHWFVSVH